MAESLNVEFTTATPAVVERWGSEGAKAEDVILLWHDQKKAYVLEGTMEEVRDFWDSGTADQKLLYLCYVASAITDLYKVVMSDRAEKEA